MSEELYIGVVLVVRTLGETGSQQIEWTTHLCMLNTDLQLSRYSQPLDVRTFHSNLGTQVQRLRDRKTYSACGYCGANAGRLPIRPNTLNWIRCDRSRKYSRYTYSNFSYVSE